MKIMSSTRTITEWDGFKAVEGEIRSVLLRFTVTYSEPSFHIDSHIYRLKDKRDRYVTLGCIWADQPVKHELLKNYDAGNSAQEVWYKYGNELEVLFGTFKSFRAAITSGMWEDVVNDPALGFMDKPESWVLEDAKQMYDEILDKASEPTAIHIRWYFAIKESDFERITGITPYAGMYLDWTPEMMSLFEKEGNTLEVFSECVIHGYIGNNDVMYDPNAVEKLKPAGTFANPKFDLLKEMKSAGLKVN